MKIDKKTIDFVLKLNDDQLWKIIQGVGAKSGITSFSTIEKPQDMSKIRSCLSSLSDDDIRRVTEILKKEKGNG
ncbi:MAG: hypothetical protein IJX02_05580 [Clostridia bacterium]|nr:hypothetical protein [Clostridia bacterium]